MDRNLSFTLGAKAKKLEIMLITHMPMVQLGMPIKATLILHKKTLQDLDNLVALVLEKMFV